MSALLRNCVAILAVTASVIAATGEEPMKNVLDGIPYSDKEPGRRKLVDEKYLLMMQVGLKPGQGVPEHKANSNVHLLVVEGKIVVTVEGREIPASKGEIVPVSLKALMSIKNASQENASFLIIKTPNPSEIKE